MMMSSKVVFMCALFVLVTADDKPTVGPVEKLTVGPVEKTPEAIIPILEQEQTFDDKGGYKWSYESGDGSKAAQEGELKDVGNDTQVEVAQGNFAYTDPKNGQTYSVQYVADEKGYQPTGDHLPVAPPVPPLIQRALAYLATAPPPEEEEKSTKSAKSNIV